MPYFFILPAYFILLLGLVGMAGVARFVPRFKPASRYIIGGTIGTLIGFIIVNIIILVAGVAPAWLARKFTFPDWLQQFSKYFVAATLLIGPFIGSGVGILIGFTVGFFYIYRRRRHDD